MSLTVRKTKRTDRVTDLQFWYLNEPRPFTFTSILDGKLNGVFSVDGCYSEKGGLSFSTQLELLDRIDRMRPELERLANAML